MMQKTVQLWLVLGGILGVASTAVATGTKLSADVSVVRNVGGTIGHWKASGALGSVRFDAPGQSMPSGFFKAIGCWVDTDPSMVVAHCHADMPVGTFPGYTGQETVECRSEDPAFIAAVASIKSDSMVSFDGYDVPVGPHPAGDCASICVENWSKYLPKLP